jgi:hypothetical protein
MNLVFLLGQYHFLIFISDDNHETIASASVLTKNVRFSDVDTSYLLAIKPVHSQTVDLYL